MSNRGWAHTDGDNITACHWCGPKHNVNSRRWFLNRGKKKWGVRLAVVETSQTNALVMFCNNCRKLFKPPSVYEKPQPPVEDFGTIEGLLEEDLIPQI